MVEYDLSNSLPTMTTSGLRKVIETWSSELENNEEEYTDVLYNNKVVGRIDQRHLNQVSITDNHHDNQSFNQPYISGS